MRRSEHSSRINGFGRHWLNDVPQLGDAVALEAEEVHDRNAWIARPLLKVRMDGDEVAIPQRVDHIKPLVRILAGTLFHAGHQRLGVTREERIVVTEGFTDVLAVGFSNATGRRVS